MDNSEKELGTLLTELRKQQQLSQEELAEKLNVTRQAISSWERNRSSPDISMLSKICLVFGISMDEFVRNSYLRFSSKTHLKDNENELVEVNGGEEMNTEYRYSPNKYDQAIGLGYAISLFISLAIFSVFF